MEFRPRRSDISRCMGPGSARTWAFTDSSALPSQGTPLPSTAMANRRATSHLCTISSPRRSRRAVEESASCSLDVVHVPRGGLREWPQEATGRHAGAEQLSLGTRHRGTEQETLADLA